MQEFVILVVVAVHGQTVGRRHEVHHVASLLVEPQDGVFRTSTDGARTWG